MKTTLRFLACALGATALPSLPGQTAPSADPRLSSWLLAPTGRYARIYETEAARAAGNAVTTWSRGQGTQTTPGYAGPMQVLASDAWIYLRSTGLGFHTMGPWYLNAAKTQLFPNYPANQNVLYRIPRNPAVPAAKTLTPGGAIGYGVDGVALFDNRDTFSYTAAVGADASPGGGGRGDGIWNRDAWVNEGVTFDPAMAHQAGANYHYHANTPALRHLLGGHVEFDAATKIYRERAGTPARHSPILGWMADGYPLYGPYGYASPTDPASGVRRMVPGYAKRDGTNGTTNLAATGRTTLPAWAARAQNRAAALAANQAGPAVGAAYILGHYLEDYDYLGDLGKTQGADFDLDLYNGRFGVTPEYPQGTYAYFLTIEPDGTPKFPYMIGRWYYGAPTGGSVTAVAEAATEYTRGGPAAAIVVTAAAAPGGGATVTWNSVEGGTYTVAASDDGTTFRTLAAGLPGAGTTTTYTAAATATWFRVTLTALATYDPRGTGGASGLDGSGVFRLGGAASAPAPVPGTSGTVRLGNLATRALVGAGDQVLIPGFTVTGTGQMRVLLRAVGPTLAAFGVTGVLADPQVTLFAGTTVVAGNDNWGSAANAAEVAAAAAQVGAFALGSGSRDAAMLVTLPPGSYTAGVSGVGGTTGTALVEVYVLE